MSAINAPIRELLKKETQFSWLPEHERAFQTVKQIFSAEPLLKMYDESKKVTIQCDASSKGLGACLPQEGKPIAYASWSLTETEQRWFQIEKELLAIVFAAERFHQYIYGKEVEVESDHKPLETILKKPIENASPRITHAVAPAKIQVGCKLCSRHKALYSRLALTRLQCTRDST